jgi:protein-S-isoprenylcysteine O-methyltransferase Ste14
MNDRFIQRGGLWVLGQSTLILAVLGLSVWFHSERTNRWVLSCGAIFLAVGCGCGIAGVASLGRNVTPFPRPMASTRLVQHGIYRRVRHPLYTAVFGVSVGWALFWQSWPALLAALGLASFLDAKARREERWLRQQFPEYDQYARHTRRFIPWVY